MITLWPILFSFLALASNSDLFDKSFPRDNAFCKLGEKTVEFMIRGASKTTDLRDKGFGEFAFYQRFTKVKSLAIGKERSGMYSFFLGKSRVCTKTLGYVMQDGSVSVLFSKDNRPYPGKLVIVRMDPKSLNVIDIIHSDYLTKQTEPIPGGFAFQAVGERTEIEMGKVTIQDTQYNYQDREFPVWISYRNNKFTTDEKISYQMLEYKKAFQDEAEFLSAAGWNASERVFKNKVPYIAVNHAKRKGCITFLPEHKKLDGSEPWKCINF